MNGQNDNSLKVLSVPKTSGYTITQKWKANIPPGPVNLVDISEDGNYIIVANDTSVTLFQKDSNSTIWTYKSPNSNTITDIGISKYGDYILAAENEQVFLLNKDPETPKTVVWQYPNNNDGAGINADISSNGEYIAVGNGTAGHVALLNNTPEVPKSNIWECKIPPAVGDIAISGDGHYTVAASESGYVYLFNKTVTAPKTPEWSYDTTSPVEYVAISDNGQYFLAANGDKEVYLFNTTNPQGHMWNYTYTANFFRSAAFSYDGTFVVLGLHGGIEYFNNTYSSTKQPMWSYPIGGMALRMEVDVSKYGEYIVLGEDDGSTLYFFNNTVTSPKQEEWYLAIRNFNDAAISADARYFVGVDDDDDLYLFHHNIPYPAGYLPPGDDDDDDDDDTGVVVVVVVIIIVSIGGVVFVIIVLIKKGIIDITILKRG
jgi:WD40 repeat protein